ncbi:alpha-N-arabinofuranosidase [Occallatibacter riparius]|uniref:non-reducing end alpha-L-arabinofuranosidase n=1 Tax=Occallatibacter riparius TaxID=1002689 RepID=A0A9J7BQY5_9BACT|nr:alpha-N-arabinofuranosidase [Occallatibacter riparius]UWZ84154.1 alpha-N-arabinofuranosidase [Occallatibacter riparius]
MHLIRTRESEKTLTRISALFVFAVLASAVNAFPQARTVTANIDVSKTGAPISKYIYGQFLEHGGDIVNNGIWSEMLVDRKFFYPVAAGAPTPPPVLGNAAGNPRFRRTPTRWWAPVGGAENVTMDKKDPYTGDQSPLVKVDAKDPHGLSESGIAVRKGKAYTGRIVLAGSPGAVVKVTLIWGKGPADRQVTTIRTLGASYRKLPLRFTAAADTDDATLEITGTGTGEFHVGAVSLMPADNIEGFRPEVIAALKQMRFGVLRFPGGNFVSSYEWRYGVGDIDKRPPIFDAVWHAVQPNDVGTDEFLTLCRLLGVDPYITVNAGFGDAWSARELVEYTNGSATTPMGKWRAQNGHPAPYGVKFWGVGNEPWGDYQMGAMSLPQFELKHNTFAKEMRKVDPSIKLIAGGAMPDVMEGADQARRINGQYVPDYLSAADWTGQLLLNCLDNIDMVSEHYYASGTEHTDMKLQKKVPIDPPLSFLEWQRAPAVQVRAKYEHYQEYLKRIPALRAKPVPIAIDEWAYFGGGPNSYKTVPAYAWAFHEMFRHSDIFQMGAFTFATAMMSQNRTEATLNPTGLLFKMYRDHFGTIPVEVSGDSPQPKPRFPAGGDQPAVNPGSDTYPLDVSAALTEDRKTLAIAVLNPSDSEQSIKVSVNGAKVAGAGKLWRMAPDSINATVQVDKKPEVQVEEQSLGALPETITVRPFSVNIYSYPVQ